MMKRILSGPNEREEEMRLCECAQVFLILPGETGGRAAKLAVSHDEEKGRETWATTVALEGS